MNWCLEVLFTVLAGEVPCIGNPHREHGRETSPQAGGHCWHAEAGPVLSCCWCGLEIRSDAKAGWIWERGTNAGPETTSTWIN